MKAEDLSKELSRFWSRVDRSTECWLWTGEKNNQGYGRMDFFESGKRTRVFAHRLAVQLAGYPLKSDDVLLHSCDTPACVNTEHLTVGGQVENIRDCLAKGRMNLTGLTAEFRQDCRFCGSEFVGAPNRRYCDIHRRKASRTGDAA